MIIKIAKFIGSYPLNRRNKNKINLNIIIN
jgi:hypothetical protein